MKELKYSLDNAEKQRSERSIALDESTKEVERKRRRVDELEVQVAKLQEELKTKYRDLQERIDAERKRANEFETKYQKVP